MTEVIFSKCLYGAVPFLGHLFVLCYTDSQNDVIYSYSNWCFCELILA